MTKNTSEGTLILTNSHEFGRCFGPNRFARIIISLHFGVQLLQRPTTNQAQKTMLFDCTTTKPPRYSEDEIDRIWAQWVRVGLCAGAQPWPHEVDIERLIIETTKAGRIESRAFKALLTFLRDYGDLVNTRRLRAMLNDADVPVLGAALEIALEHGGAAAYKKVIEKCWPYDEPQLLAVGMEKYELFVESKVTNAKPEYLKWGLYETMVQFYNDAWRDRQMVLEDNFNLRIRARLGPNRLAQILIALHGVVHHIGRRPKPGTKNHAP